MIPINVVCAIILKGSEILVVQRSETMSLPLKWEFPGGKMEINESEEDCLHRELKEELNIGVKIIARLESSIYDYGNQVIKLIPFVVEYLDGEITLLEHREQRACAIKSLKYLDLAPADIPVLDFFLLYLERDNNLNERNIKS